MNDDTFVREAEAAWLRQEMNRTGLGNQQLHEALSGLGWAGTVNNVSNWRGGLTPIPDSLVPQLIRVFGRDPASDGLTEVVHFYGRRYPFLLPFLREPSPEVTRPSPSSRRPEPVYYGRRGAHQGQRYVLYQDASGQYVAGTSRFEVDKQAFGRKDDLFRALKANPELRVRMVPEKAPGTPPSLIHQRSLVWE